MKYNLDTRVSAATLARAGWTYLILGATLLSPLAHGATYYVSTSGSDSNPGSQSAPLRHLSKAAATARNPGDTVIVMDGTYDNEGVVEPNFVVTLQYSGTASSPITFMAQNRGRAILDSMNTSTTTTCNGAAAYFNLYNASFIVIQGFVIQRGCDSGIQSNDYAHDITLRWNEIRYIANRTVTDQIGRDGIYLNTSEYNFTFDGNVFHDIGRTGGTSLLHFDHGIYSHAKGLTIINNVFYNLNRGYSIQLADGAANWLVANNTFAFGNGNGEAGDIMFWGSNSNITMENNIFYLPNSSALTQYAATISGSAFNHNLIYGVSSIMSGSTAGINVGTNQIGPNPTFANAGATPPNFQLQSSSPAIAAGVSLSTVTTDINGANRPSPPDLGAYQSGAAGPIISSVFTSSLTSNSVFVNWSTNTPSTSYVQYGPSGYSSSTTPVPTLVTQHSVALSGLAASTLYHFRAASQDASGNLSLSSDFTFTTSAVPTTFAVSATSPSAVVAPGNSTATTIAASLVTGNSAPVSFSASGQPAGTTTFSTMSCTLTCATTLTITVSSIAAPGTYNVVVTGTGAGTSASTAVALTVSAVGGDITTGLKAQWLMNQNSGTTAWDFSGNGNNGNIYNGYWWAAGPGQVLYFNGNNSYVAVNESSSLEMSSQLTVSLWLDPNANSNVDPRVIDKLYDWDIKMNGANRYPQFESGGMYAMLNYPLALQTWHNIVFTYSSGVVKGYVDGVAVPFLQNTFTGTGTLPQWAYGLYLGTDGYSPLIGNLSDVRIYNRALSPTDVAALYLAK